MKNVSFCAVILALCACDKESPEEIAPPDFISGTYTGVYNYSISYPKPNGNGTYYMWSNDTTYSSELKVTKTGSSKYLLQPINPPDFISEFDVQLDSGNSWLLTGGSGSSYMRSSVSFRNDSLIYEHFHKCGIPCSSSESFVAVKK